jgi:hypothetical protein
MKICIHVCIHTLFIFLFFLDNKKTLQTWMSLHKFLYIWVRCFWRFLAVFQSFSPCLYFVSVYSWFHHISVSSVCVCRCDLRLPFPAHLFSGVTVLRQWIGVFLWLLSVLSQTLVPPRALLCAPLTVSVWGLTGTSVPHLHISLSCLFWTTPSLSTCEY